MLEIKVDLDKASRKPDIVPQIRKDTGAMVTTIPSKIREDGLDRAAGVNTNNQEPESKPFVWFWDREQEIGIYMTVEKEARLRNEAEARN